MLNVALWLLGWLVISAACSLWIGRLLNRRSVNESQTLVLAFRSAEEARLDREQIVYQQEVIAAKEAEIERLKVEAAGAVMRSEVNK